MRLSISYISTKFEVDRVKTVPRKVVSLRPRNDHKMTLTFDLEVDAEPKISAIVMCHSWLGTQEISKSWIARKGSKQNDYIQTK